jgi:hypothetical protein
MKNMFNSTGTGIVFKLIDAFQAREKKSYLKTDIETSSGCPLFKRVFTAKRNELKRQQSNGIPVLKIF